MAEPGAPCGRKILVVDDDADTRKVIAMFLKGEGFEVVTAESGLEGVRMARQESPDLIVLDVEMPPGIDGAEVCRRIRSDPGIPRMPILFLTAKAHLEAMEETFEEEAQGYILKPLSTFDLMVEIDKLLGRAGGSAR